jgi:hypothetical protein
VVSQIRKSGPGAPGGFPSYPVEFPRLGFAYCLPVRIGYVVDSMQITSYYFRSSRLLLAEQLLHICASYGANQWFMNWLRIWRRQKDAVFHSPLSAISCQGSGAAYSSDCFDCAPGGGNIVHKLWIKDRGSNNDGWGSWSLDRDQGSEIRDQKNAGWGSWSPMSENPDLGHPTLLVGPGPPALAICNLPMGTVYIQQVP